MSLSDRYSRPTPTAEKGGVSCSHYSPLPQNKHCRHYLPNGACSRPGELMCVEWLKANKQSTTVPKQVKQESKPVEPRSNQFKLNHPEPKTQTAHISSQRRQPATRTPQQRPLNAWFLKPADITRFKQLGLEVCLHTDAGEIWIVPRYTSSNRIELEPEHAALLAFTALAFPNSKVTSINRNPSIQTGG